MSLSKPQFKFNCRKTSRYQRLPIFTHLRVVGTELKICSDSSYEQEVPSSSGACFRLKPIVRQMLEIHQMLEIAPSRSCSQFTVNGLQ